VATDGILRFLQWGKEVSDVEWDSVEPDGIGRPFRSDPSKMDPLFKLGRKRFARVTLAAGARTRDDDKAPGAYLHSQLRGELIDFSLCWIARVRYRGK
jgi:hypothetical protein